MNQLKKLSKFKTKIDLFDVLGFSILFGIVLVLVLFFLGKGGETYVVLRVSQNESLSRPWFIDNESPQWYIANITPGLADKDLLGRSNVEVVDVYYYPTISPNQTIFTQLKLRTRYDKQKKQHSFGGQPLVVGSSQEFDLEGVKVVGVVQEVSETPIQRDGKRFKLVGYLENQFNEANKFSAETIFEGIRTFVADKIAKGAVVKDSKGEVIAEVIVVNKQPAFREFVSGNQIIEVRDQDRTKVDLEVVVTAYNLGQDLYLYKEETPLAINGGISLNFGDFEVWMTIKEIEEI